jgi:AcrR family transcriptional regulator
MNEIPRAVRALWGDPATPRRGPKPAMSVHSIAAAGAAIADADGLSAVSMAAVASRLGFTTMSLYRYVDTKDDLHLVMADVALGAPPEPNRRRGWRGQLEDWARAELLTLGRHPWVLEVRPGGPPLGPNTLAWMEAGLQAFDKTRLTGQQAASCLLTVDGYVRNAVLLAQQFNDAEASVRWADRLRTVIDRDAMPSLAAALDAGVFEDERPVASFPGDEFDFGLGLVLDGIEHLVRGGL